MPRSIDESMVDLMTRLLGKGETTLAELRDSTRLSPSAVQRCLHVLNDRYPGQLWCTYGRPSRYVLLALPVPDPDAPIPYRVVQS